MLELRPGCEHCNAPLPPDSTEAMICSFECTFCRNCATTVLGNVCPNCGGGFCQRPVRPGRDLKGGNCLANYPASMQAKHRPVDLGRHADFASDIAPIAPERR